MNKRRKRQQYLLEVKVHTEGRTRQRLGRVAGLLAIVAAVALGSYGVYRLGKWTANKLVFQNPRFLISQIVVQNNGVLQPQVIARFAGVNVGQNLLGLDLAQARRNLELVPLIRSAEVRRVMPGRLVIQVEERTPVARVQVAGRDHYYVDRTGVVMKTLKLNDGTVIEPQGQGPLPWLTGMPATDVQVGRRMETEAVYQALNLLEQINLSPAGTMVEVDRVDVSKPRTLTVATRQGLAVQFDTEDVPQQLRRLGVILMWAQQRQKGVRTVDLTVSRAVPVTFVN